jgi:hypothetical protein
LGAYRWFYDIYSVAGQAGGLTGSASAKVEAAFTSGTTTSRVLGVTVTASGAGPDALASWAPNPANESVSGYRIWLDGSHAATVAAPAASFTIASLAYGDTVSFAAQAEGPAGAGNTSVAYAYLHLPPAPASLTITAAPDNPGNSITGLRLDWADINGAAQYNIYRATYAFSREETAGMTPQATASASALRDTTLTAGALYYYRVAAWANGVTGAASLQARGVVPAAPQPVTGLAAAAASPSLGFNWSPPVSGGPLEAFLVFRSTSPISASPTAAAIQLPPNASSFVDSGGSPGVMEYMAVAAANSGARSALEMVSAWPVPSAPSLSQATAGFDGVSSTVSLSWNSVSGAGNQYVVLTASAADMSSAVAVTTVSALSHTVAGPATEGAPTYYAVAAYNQVTGAASPALAVTVAAGLPGVPAALSGARFARDQPTGCRRQSSRQIRKMPAPQDERPRSAIPPDPR